MKNPGTVSDDNMGDIIIGAIISEPTKFWSRVMNNEVASDEIPDEYMGTMALSYMSPEFKDIFRNFYPIRDMTPHDPNTSGESITFRNSLGCAPQEDRFLLHYKEVFADNFESGSSKQSQIEHDAFLSFVFNLGELLKKQQDKLLYMKVGDMSPFSSETSAKSNLMFME